MALHCILCQPCHQHRHQHQQEHCTFESYVHIVLLTNDLADPIDRTDCLFSSRFATDFANRVDLVDSMLFVVSSFVLWITIGSTYSTASAATTICCSRCSNRLHYYHTDCTVVRLLFASAASLFACLFGELKHHTLQNSTQKHGTQYRHPSCVRDATARSSSRF